MTETVRPPAGRRSARGGRDGPHAPSRTGSPLGTVSAGPGGRLHPNVRGTPRRSEGARFPWSAAQPPAEARRAALHRSDETIPRAPPHSGTDGVAVVTQRSRLGRAPVARA